MNPIPLKEQLERAKPGKLKPGTSLRQLINRLVSNLLIVAAGSRTSITNEVAADLYFETEEMTVASIVDELLTAVVANARQGNIHIRAERLQDAVTLDIQERNNYNGFALLHRVRSMEPDAARVGGYIKMDDYRKLQTHIFFSFADQRKFSVMA